MAKIRCLNPKHQDETPSMEIYEEWLHCYVCGYRVKNQGEYEAPKREPTNIAEKLQYIQNLPQTRVRGLSLPTDRTGYYIVWPNSEYYKLRRFDNSPRYEGPAGHKPPMFILESNSTSLVLVEGEINALSVAESCKTRKFTTASPGSATELVKAVDYCLKFKTIYIIVDKDPAGVYYGLGLKSELLKHKRRVSLVALEEDLNQTLQNYGPEKVKEKIQEIVGTEY